MWLAVLADCIVCVLLPAAEPPSRLETSAMASHADPRLAWWHVLLYGTSDGDSSLARGLLPTLLSVIAVGVALPSTTSRAVRVLGVLLARMHDPVACLTDSVGKGAQELLRQLRSALTAGAAEADAAPSFRMGAADLVDLLLQSVGALVDVEPLTVDGDSDKDQGAYTAPFPVRFGWVATGRCGRGVSGAYPLER